MSDTPQDHQHELVWVTSPGETQARQYCGGCGYRGEWQALPPELQPETDDLARRLEDELIETGTDPS